MDSELANLLYTPDDPNTPADSLASTVTDDAASRPNEDVLSVHDDALVICQLHSNLRC
jgi:hypothetical protein